MSNKIIHNYFLHFQLLGYSGAICFLCVLGGYNTLGTLYRIVMQFPPGPVDNAGW